MMDKEELVYKYLTHKGYLDIKYEPNKSGLNSNVPPDFSVDGNIGIEVRRLNQHLFNPNKAEPLEDLDFGLIPRINNLLKSYSDRNYENSAFVNIRYSRPLSSKKVIKKLTEELDKHLTQLHVEKQFFINDTLSIEFLPASLKHESAYLLGAVMDYDGGGHLVSNMYRNLEHVINEKQDKVTPYFDLYNTWWLILVDYISYGISSYDLDQLNKLIPINHQFSKIILLSPLDFSKEAKVKI